MQSAPAVLRMPVEPMQSEFQDEVYPWATRTPEDSPRCFGVVPHMHQVRDQVMPGLSAELLHTVCAPYYEQMRCSVVGQGMPAEALASRDVLRAMCEPFFEQMTTALQQKLHQQSLQGQPLDSSSLQSTAGSCFQPVFCSSSPYYQQDGESTEADDSCPFSSLLSGPSSETDGLDITEGKSDGSEPASDLDKNVMVCRHWKSKGWCRMESKCKFLHPESKRGVSAPSCCKGSEGGARATSAMPVFLGAESGDLPPTSSAVQRRKRGGKKKSTKKQQGNQFGNEE